MALFLTASLLSFLTTSTALPQGNWKPWENHSSTLHWAPCELDFGWIEAAIQVPVDCATLDVPLDYTNPDSRPLTLQLIKVNATKEPFLGSVLFNPGGPGGSGVEDIVITGPIYNAVLGGQYDLVGFDPRGTGKTIPFDCDLWPSASNSTDKEISRRSLLPEQNMTEVLLDRHWEAARYVSEQCYQTQQETGSFLSTAFVARDMVQIIDALGEDGMLRYWGVSYGTLLGATFAAMFPERIDRMFIDSVVNPTDYMTGKWLTATLDVDGALQEFFEECILSPDYCALSNFSGPSTTAQDLLDATAAAFSDLLENPRYLPADAPAYAWNLNPPRPLYDDIKTALFSYLYSPSVWPLLASQMVDILQFNYSSFEDAVDVPLELYNEGVNALLGIACSDSSFRAEKPEDMFELVAAQQNISAFGDVVHPLLWPCYQWKFQAAERYEGDFKAKTNFPILIVNGHYDPITPFSSAVNDSKNFEGSVLLTHGGHGHSFYSDPSICTARAIRAYFVNGTLPKPNTYCEPDAPAFQINVTALADGSAFNETASGLVKRDGSPMEQEDEAAELSWAMKKLMQYDADKRMKDRSRLLL